MMYGKKRKYYKGSRLVLLLTALLLTAVLLSGAAACSFIPRQEIPSGQDMSDGQSLPVPDPSESVSAGEESNPEEPSSPSGSEGTASEDGPDDSGEPSDPSSEEPENSQHEASEPPEGGTE
ncbi:MAG: hypothetical protein IKS34_05715, partial [Clostridia bacterium]|nr:hypothetical protein [Clostridia bacterium]